MTATDEGVRILIPYKCPSCDTDLEFDPSGWAAWRVCPRCKMPSPVPEPTVFAQSQVTADSIEFGPLNRATPQPGSSRFDWLDGVVPARTSQQPGPERILHEAGFVEVQFEEVESRSLTVRPLPITPPEVPRGSEPPHSAGPVLPPETSPEMFAALSRPARVTGTERPAYSYAPRASNGRVFLGIALCVTTIGCLFKLLDNDTNLALVFGLAAVVALFLLARPGQRY